jgi:hypothetical protein
VSSVRNTVQTDNSIALVAFRRALDQGANEPMMHTIVEGSRLMSKDKKLKMLKKAAKKAAKKAGGKASKNAKVDRADPSTKPPSFST